MRVILRRPSRGLGQDAAERICRALDAGATLPEAIERLPVNAGDHWRLEKAAQAFSALTAIEDAGALIARLRADGLDQHVADVARASARPDRDDLTVLADAEREAAGKTVAEHAATLAGRRLSLRKARDDRHGIELTTVHRAKGRQWPRVVVVACDEDVLPHRNALQERADTGEGVEAERRIAYVAFTRAIEELSILYTEERPSRFLHEAGLIAAPPKPAAPVAPPSRAGFWQRAGPPVGRSAVRRAHEVGLHHALTVIPDRQTALEFAAVALKRDLAGPATRSEQLTVRQFLKAIAGLSRAERQRVQRAVPGLDAGNSSRSWHPTGRNALAATLRVLARR